ncbi:hypothetical protein SMI10712_00665 [Streptococcus mitis]|uniref:Uncharacterized protein n=1 Tax=Streptococcus mitis TaxID=28037 RepID=A0A150NI14_STRMT|nr:hypothetical protein SMI10712_00665 [Streptococcus mitis]
MEEELKKASKSMSLKTMYISLVIKKSLSVFISDESSLVYV